MQKKLCLKSMCYKICWAFFTIISAIWTQAHAYDLPDLGEHSATVFTSKQAEKLGREFFQEVQRSVPVCHDAIINDYIQALGDKLVAHTSAKNKTFHYFVVLDPSINAFAGPGGYIGVNSGAILVSRTESELAAILAHETAHVSQHHIERLYEQAQGMEIPAIAAMAAALVFGASASSSTASSMATGAAMAGMAGTAQHQINFTREQEAEADHIGMQTLTKAVFDPNAMASSFEHVQRVTYEYAENSNDYPADLIDHPLTNVRIADAKARENFFPATKVTSSKMFYLIKARLANLQTQEKFRAIDYFKNALTAKKAPLFAQQYGYALALLSNRQFDQATKQVNQLLHADPNEVVYQLTAATIQENNHAPNAAEATLKNALGLHPDYLPLILQYADTLTKNNKSSEAVTLLRQKSLDFPDRIEIFLLLAQAEAKSGHLADAYQARATAMELYGANRQAILLLQQAQKLPRLTANNKAVIAARIQRLKKQYQNNI